METYTTHTPLLHMVALNPVCQAQWKLGIWNNIQIRNSRTLAGHKNAVSHYLDWSGLVLHPRIDSISLSVKI